MGHVPEEKEKRKRQEEELREAWEEAPGPQKKGQVEAEKGFLSCGNLLEAPEVRSTGQ